MLTKIAPGILLTSQYCLGHQALVFKTGFIASYSWNNTFLGMVGTSLYIRYTVIYECQILDMKWTLSLWVKMLLLYLQNLKFIFRNPELVHSYPTSRASSSTSLSWSEFTTPAQRTHSTAWQSVGKGPSINDVTQM